MTGDRLPADRYLVDFDSRDLPSRSTDVLVVGGGVAGLSAALAASEGGRVTVLLKDDAGVSNTAWAQGGIAAAIDAGDTVEEHVADTLSAGGDLCRPDIVRQVAAAAPAAVERLMRLGARFDTKGSGGGLALGREGGHGKRRILHADGDATGAECSRALVEAVTATPSVGLLPRTFMVDLLTDEAGDGRCVGALVLDEAGRLGVVRAGSVVLAAGGAGRLFRETTNVPGATGDGIAAAFRAGAVLQDLEFVQFHPTTLYLAGSERILVTEAVRGEGARLIDNRGERFLAGVHPDAELAPRDVVSRAIVEHLGRPGVTGVFLDLRHWPASLASDRFPSLAATCARYGLDPARDPIPVRPAAHYFIGGVACDAQGRTGRPGLYACGEAACSGLHGANRLASNSLLEGLVLGAEAGACAQAERAGARAPVIVHRAARDRGRVDVADLRESLRHLLWRTAGVRRTGDGLAEALDWLGRWEEFAARANLGGRDGFEVRNLLLLGSMLSASAARREETRGTHVRRDFPERDDTRFFGSFAWRRGAGIEFVPREAVACG